MGKAKKPRIRIFTGKGAMDKLQNREIVKLKKDVRTLRRSIEVKNTNSPRTENNVDYNGLLVTLNEVAQGNSDVTRIGDSVLMTGIEIAGVFDVDGAATDANVVRVVIFWDHQNDISSAGDILQTVGQENATNSPKHWDNKRRYSIIYDRRSVITPGTNRERWLFKFNKNFSKTIQYQAGTTAILNNALKVLLISDQVTTNLPDALFYTRMRYRDG